MLERKIIIGLITSTEYIQQIQHAWNDMYLESQMAKRIAGWCMEYFEQYNKAPGRNIENIYYQKLHDGLPEEIAEEIEQDILPGLSQEFEEEEINIDYLRDQTLNYFKEKQLLQFSEQVKNLAEAGELLQAEQLACDYHPIITESKTDLNLNSEVALNRIEKAFSDVQEPIIKYPKQLGQFWNHQLTKGKFVALMAIEKRGKSFWLLDMALRACKNSRKVAFFQAGDMTEDEQLLRICTFLTKKSNERRYCGKIFEPVCDCVKNQLDTCDKDQRECDFGIFSDRTEKQLRYEITIDELKEAYANNPDYVACHNCREYSKGSYGCVWIKEVDVGKPLTCEESKSMVEEFFIKNQRGFKLSTHANGTLTVRMIRSMLDVWEKSEDFVPDIIVIDYADLLDDEKVKEFRHKQNAIWRGLRRVSQEKNQPLVVTVTQADAQGYDQDRLRLRNFSEDKRKYGHVTAMYGLNQDHNDREKNLGIMRINELVLRHGGFSNSKEIFVLQNLKRGRPFIGSYF